jgi:hypothetical protein
MLRRTKNISLIILTSIAAAACDETPPPNTDIKHCVDENGVVQDESNCQAIPEDAGTHDPQHPHSSSPHFFWYYGGGGGVVSPGTRVTGGSFSPSPGKAYSPPSTITRGGFGATGAGHAGGGE